MRNFVCMLNSRVCAVGLISLLSYYDPRFRPEGNDRYVKYAPENPKKVCSLAKTLTYLKADYHYVQTRFLYDGTHFWLAFHSRTFLPTHGILLDDT